MQNNPNEKILRLRSVLALTGLSRSMVYVLIKQGAFPSPINLSLRAVGWIESEINHWIADRVNFSRSKAAKSE